MSRRNKNLGDWGEEQACMFLRRHGFQIKERNYHATVGEIDIIATQGDDYYFIEVKTRTTDDDLAKDTAITEFKKYKLNKTMKHYCFHRHIAECSLILAGIMVVANRSASLAKFRFCVLY